MPAAALRLGLSAVLAVVCLSGCATHGRREEPPAPAMSDGAKFPTAAPLRVVRRYAAPEAKQAVAVDRDFFYAIDDAAIGKYDKWTGQRVTGWSGDGGAPVIHLDSGVVIGRRLYCAHSNFPHVPMISSIEVFDTRRMTRLESIPLPRLGSATWVDRARGTWWVTFAHYAGEGGEPGKTPKDTRLVQFNDRWQQLRAWSFPSVVVERWDGMSNSGGVWDGRTLYTTGHHAKEIYVLEVPASGSELLLREIIPFESEGQGIALDRDGRLLYSIQRTTREVLVSDFTEH